MPAADASHAGVPAWLPRCYLQDTIPQFGFVVAYVGEVYDAEEHG